MHVCTWALGLFKNMAAPDRCCGSQPQTLALDPVPHTDWFVRKGSQTVLLAGVQEIAAASLFQKENAYLTQFAPQWAGKCYQHRFLTLHQHSSGLFSWFFAQLIYIKR